MLYMYRAAKDGFELLILLMCSLASRRLHIDNIVHNMLFLYITKFISDQFPET